MKKLIIAALALISSLSAFSQDTEATQLSYKDIVATNPLTSGRVANALNSIIKGKPNYIGAYTATGTDTYAATIVSSFTAYTKNDVFTINFTNANTTSCTLNFNGVGAKALVKNDGTALSAGDIPANSYYLIAYDGTSLRIVGSAGGSGGGSWPLTGTANLTGNVVINASGHNFQYFGDGVSGNTYWDSQQLSFYGYDYADFGSTGPLVIYQTLGGNYTALEFNGSGNASLTTAGSITLHADDDLVFDAIPSNGSPTNALSYNSSTGLVSYSTWPSGSSGTVTDFSAGNLSPLFTTTESTTTTTPALSFSLNTQTANTVFSGPTTGSAAAPTFRSLVAADLPSMTSTVGGAVPTPPNDATKYLNGQGAFTVVAPTITGSQGDLIYLSATNTIGNLAKSTSGVRILSNQGASNNPTWTATTAGSAVTLTSTYIVPTTTGTPSTGAVDAWGASWKLNNISAIATGDLIQGTGTDILSVLPSVAAGSYLRSAGTSTASVWSTLILPNAATANRIVFASATNTWSDDADLTFDGTSMTITGKINYAATNTAGGVTGNQTINKPSGTVNIAAAGTTVTVTNSFCTTSSIVMATVRTNDTTAYIKNVVPGSGSFVINLGAAATAETSIGFLVIN